MLIPSGYAQINWIFEGDACPRGAECTLGVSVEDFPGTPLDAAEEAYDAWVVNMLPVQTTLTTLRTAKIKYGPNETGPFAEFSGDATGDLSLSGMPPMVAILMTKITAQGGRSGRGRMYVPGVDETDVSARGIIDPAYRAAWEDGFQGLFVQLGTAELVPYLLHGESSPAPTPYPIINGRVETVVATQRRRNRS